RIALLAGTAVSAAGGIFLLVAGISAGWLLLSIAVALSIPYLWWQGELQRIPAVPQAQAIDQLLESDLLALLPAKPTPQDVAERVMQLPGGHFFAARFGIGPTFLLHMTSDDASDMQAVWQEALTLRQRTGETALSTVVVTAALVRTIPNVQTYLAQLQLGPDDVATGAEWFVHLRQLIERFHQPRRTGGIARDWSFGYTPLLRRFGVNISEQVASGGQMATALESHTDALRQMISTLSGGGRQNVALVGPLGVGKSTVVHAFAEEIIKVNGSVPRRLRFRQVIALDASTLISQARGRGDLEGLINELLLEAYRAKNVIICLDDAQLFFEEGVGSVDLSNVLQPILEGGVLPIILTMNEQRWLQISQRNPALVATMNRVTLAPPDRAETTRVLQDQLILLEFRHKVTFMFQALEEAYRLSERYIHEQAMPGKAIKLLESAASYALEGVVTAVSVQQAIEKTMDIKVGTAQTNDERETLLNLEQLIHERMINQTHAVSVVSDALRRARAGVRNPDRPVGTFLFLGPTGVGKTELSKALADVYFGGEDRLIRVDLNEFVRSEDVARLIADGARDVHSLTAQITHQPFSVVLLDEIEKAHPDVLNTLLQLLDEGILRDINNREVSFRDAIIIATSNAGADKIREYIQEGKQLEQFEAEFINQLIDSNQFRPEFLNRFDEITVFRPLTQDELLQVVDLIIRGINKNLAVQKISVTVANDVKRMLVSQGYDARLGARPMRRVVQRTIENFIARRMLSGAVEPGATIEITAADITPGQ
ncbi:Clp protease, partial [Candidatus Saccharibacteria bacterium]